MYRKYFKRILDVICSLGFILCFWWLYIVNIFPFSPGLCCLKITGKPNFLFTRKATIIYNHQKHKINPKEQTISKILLKYFLYIFIPQNIFLLFLLQYLVLLVSFYYRLEGIILFQIYPFQYQVVSHLFLTFHQKYKH